MIVLNDIFISEWRPAHSPNPNSINLNRLFKEVNLLRNVEVCFTSVSLKIQWRLETDECVLLNRNTLNLHARVLTWQGQRCRLEREPRLCCRHVLLPPQSLLNQGFVCVRIHLTARFTYYNRHPVSVHVTLALASHIILFVQSVINELRWESGYLSLLVCLNLTQVNCASRTLY